LVVPDSDLVCAQVDGVGEKLAKELNLKHGTTSDQHKGDTRI
jgi:hypothetical protein